jgi:hypothetical protein
VFARESTVAAMTAPLFPSVGSAPTGGSSMTCSTSSSTLSVPAGSHGQISTTYYPTCSTINFTGAAGTETDVSGGLSLGGSSVTLNFTNAGTYKIASGINITGGSTTVVMNVANGSTVYLWGGINITGSSSLTVNGSATWYIQGGINYSTGGAMTFNNTSGSTSTFYIAGGIAIGNSGAVTFPSGTYVITSGDGTAGIDLKNGGDNVTFGAGSFNIANGINIAGGSTLTFGAALNGTSVFQIPTVTNVSDASGLGKVAIATGGGSTLTIGNFGNYDLNGPLWIQGNFYLGTGIYTVNGGLDVAAAGGCCLTGTNVSIIADGPISFGAGYSTVNLTAPSTISSTSQGTAATVVLATNSSSGSMITAGASNTTLVGTLYLPNSTLTMSGAGNLNGGGNCLEVVTNGVVLSGSGAISTTCSSLGGSGSSSSVALVQ